MYKVPDAWVASVALSMSNDYSGTHSAENPAECERYGQLENVTRGVLGGCLIARHKVSHPAQYLIHRPENGMFGLYRTSGFDRDGVLRSLKPLLEDPNKRKIGQHAQDTAELFFNNVKVPKENILGAPGMGFMMLIGAFGLLVLVLGHGLSPWQVDVVRAGLPWWRSRTSVP